MNNIEMLKYFFLSYLVFLVLCDLKLFIGL